MALFKAVHLTINAQKVLIENRHVLCRMSACVSCLFLAFFLKHRMCQGASEHPQTY